MKRLIAFSVILMLLIGMGTGCSPAKKADAAPDFSLPGLDGETYTLSEMSGKLVVLYFWQASCPPCVAKLPALAAMDSELPENVELWLVNLQDGEGRIRDLVDQYPNLTVLMNGVSVFLDYNFRYTPTVAFIGPQGDLLYAQPGMTEGQIEAKIDELK